MEKVITINNRDETLVFGEYLGKLLKPHMLLTLNGDLGAGKTTFTKGIGKGLGIKRIINSPTFTILKQYQGNYQLSHFEFLEDILPQERLAMTIKRIDDDRREFILKPIGKKYEELVKEIEYENNCHG